MCVCVLVTCLTSDFPRNRERHANGVHRCQERVEREREDGERKEAEIKRRRRTASSNCAQTPASSEQVERCMAREHGKREGSEGERE